MTGHSRTIARGFTLVELVAVIVVLGVLAGVAVPKYLDFSSRARVSRIAEDLGILHRSLWAYNRDTGLWPPDTTVWGQELPELQPYFMMNPFANRNALGGQYDWNPHTPQHHIGMANWSSTSPSQTEREAVMTQVDQFIDDGNLNSGLLRRAAWSTDAYAFYMWPLP